MKRKKLGEVLRERGHITPDNLIRAIESQQGTPVHLGEVMLERGLVSRHDLAGALSEVTRVPYVDCGKLPTDPVALELVPYALAKRCCALPIQTQGKTNLVVAMAQPQNLQIVDELSFSTGMEIVPRLAFRDEIEAAIEKWYAAAKHAGSAAEEASASPAKGAEIQFTSSNSRRNVDAAREMQTDLLQNSTPAVRLVASILTAAANKQASGVHIEPQSSDAVVRLRVDGMLRDYQRIPRVIESSAVSRIKILSDMDIGERKAPQDGRFLVRISGRRIEFRVSTLPTQHGEKVVMHLIEADAPLRDFDGFGFPARVSDGLKRLLSAPEGMVLVTGPAASGRTTTLYSLLNFARKPSANVVTVEDPVQYAVPGISQVEVNKKRGLTFAGCLRSVLRQDPNVIAIGEIQDRETAEIAVKAAQTGHLVLATLHTNDSAAALTRLLDLGVPAFEIAASVTGIVAQRLIRRLCACHKIIAASPEYVSRLKGAGVTKPPEMESVPAGCEVCDLTGYKGRMGVFELLELNDSVRSAIRSGARNEEIRTLARQNGMKLMQEHAIERVCEGVTTIEEVQRVVPFEPRTSNRCSGCAGELSPAFLFCPFCGEKVVQAPASPSRGASLVEQGARRK